MSLSKEKVAQLFVYSSRCGHQRKGEHCKYYRTAAARQEIVWREG